MAPTAPAGAACGRGLTWCRPPAVHGGDAAGGGPLRHGARHLPGSVGRNIGRCGTKILTRPGHFRGKFVVFSGNCGKHVP